MCYKLSDMREFKVLKKYSRVCESDLIEIFAFEHHVLLDLQIRRTLLQYVHHTIITLRGVPNRMYDHETEFTLGKILTKGFLFHVVAVRKIDKVVTYLKISVSVLMLVFECTFER